MQVDKDTEILEKFNVMDYSLLLGIHKPQEEPERVRFSHTGFLVYFPRFFVQFCRLSHQQFELTQKIN